MRALAMPEAGVLQTLQMEKPLLSDGHAVIKMSACGICGSDLTAYRGTNPTVRYPIIGIGHEGVGVIAEIGENARGLKAGDRVALEPYIACHTCHSCAEGRFNNCVNLRLSGVHTTGMMMEYCSHPISLLHKIPDGMEFAEAALTEPLTIGLHGVSRAGVKQGEYCLVTGAGPIGLLAAFGVMSRGATPILTDILEERLAFARSLGIRHTYCNTDGGLLDYLKEVTNGKLPECMVECTGTPAVLGAMHEYVCHGGRIALVGWAKEPVTINTIRCMQKELDLRPSRNSNGKFPEALRLIGEERIPVREMTTKTVKLEEVEDTIKDMIQNPQNYMKVVVNI